LCGGGAGGNLAYSDRNDAFELPLRTLRRSFDFSGRSRRTEVIYYWITAYFLSLILGFAISAFSSLNSLFAVPAARGFVSAPMFALLVRRLHDQDRSGWWALLLPLDIALALPDMMRWLSSGPGELMAYLQSGPHPIQWLQQAIWLATIVAFMLDGTEGPNRYGEDPRLTED
jgi:uncharacterized membrane protein YhaH (DUF805 family)